MSLDNDVRASMTDPELDTKEQWRAHPERTEPMRVHAFGLYFRLRIPHNEAFDGSLSVGVTRPMPGEADAEHSPSVVLGYTGDSGVAAHQLVA